MPAPDGESRNATRSATSAGSSRRLTACALEDHVLEHALLGEAVRLRLIADLRLDERRPHVGRADGRRGDPDLRSLERERLHEAEHAVLRRHVARLEGRCRQRMRGGDHADPSVARASRAHPTRTSRAGTARSGGARAARPTGPRESREPAPRAGSLRSGRSRRAGRTARARRHDLLVPAAGGQVGVLDVDAVDVPAVRARRSTIAEPMPPARAGDECRPGTIATRSSGRRRRRRRRASRRPRARRSRSSSPGRHPRSRRPP